MDSMRSLNTSLPTASPRRRRQPSHPPEHLLQSFRAAALSVTNLYKAAASHQDEAYHSGYQDALSDLLELLDKENLGLQDGEGWRVRQWATEKYQPGSNGVPESEDEEADDKATRESSPTLRRKTSQDLALSRTSESTHTQSESAPPITAPSIVETPTHQSTTTTTTTTATTTTSQPRLQAYPVPSGDFTFSSTTTNHQHPHVHDTDMDASTDGNGTVHINVVHPARTTRGSRQGSARRNGSSLGLGHGAGMKRRLPNFDFFDLGGFDGSGQGGGGGKRGRFT